MKIFCSSEEIECFDTELFSIIFCLLIEMEDNNHKPEHKKEHAITKQDERNLSSWIQEQGQAPAVSILLHICNDKEDRLGNDGGPSSQATLSIAVIHCDGELFNEIV